MSCLTKRFRKLQRDLQFPSSELYSIEDVVESCQEDAADSMLQPIESLDSVKPAMQVDLNSSHNIENFEEQTSVESKANLQNRFFSLKLKYLIVRRCTAKRKLLEEKWRSRFCAHKLTDAQLQLYEQLTQGSPEQVLVSKFNLNITRESICSLMGSNWLNDEVINFYMDLLTERSANNSKKLPRVYAMNTFFVARLLRGGYDSVKRWTRKVDLFSKDIIPVPVHKSGQHWCMAIIHLRNKTIRYYDSMGHSNQKVLNALEMYLHAESLDKLQRPYDTTTFFIKGVKDSPRQKNVNDCGVFACMTAEHICRQQALSFSQKHMDFFRKKMLLEICAGKLWLT